MADAEAIPMKGVGVTEPQQRKPIANIVFKDPPNSTARFEDDPNSIYSKIRNYLAEWEVSFAGDSLLPKHKRFIKRLVAVLCTVAFIFIVVASYRATSGPDENFSHWTSRCEYPVRTYEQTPLYLGELIREADLERDQHIVEALRCHVREYDARCMHAVQLAMAVDIMIIVDKNHPEGKVYINSDLSLPILRWTVTSSEEDTLFPGQKIVKSRMSTIRVAYTDETGQTQSHSLQDETAICFQHLDDIRKNKFL